MSPADGEDGRAFEHVLDEIAVGLLGAAQGINLLASRPLHDERIDLPGANCAESFFSFLQPLGERPNLVH